MNRQKELDAIRGIACLIVVATHSFSFAYPTASIGYGNLVAGTGKIGVWLFFVLSSFLLTGRLMKTGLGSVALIEYAIGRCTRILIPFFFAVVFYRLAGTSSISSWGDALDVLTFQKSANHLWTIPVEFSFYVVLPVIMLALAKLPKLSGQIIFLVSIAVCCLIAWPPALTPINALWIGWYIPSFIAGSAVALLVRTPIEKRYAQAVGIAAALAVVAFTVAAKLNLFGNAEMILVDKHYLYGILWAGVVYSVYVAPPTWLSARWLTKVGEWSYSTYLFHWAFAIWATTYLDGVLAMAVAIAASLLAGWLGYHVLELPSQHLRDTLVRRLKSTPYKPTA